MISARRLVAVLPVVAFATSVAAQAPDLTEVSFENLTSLKISSASKFVQSAREAPSAVEVITREDIRRHGWQALSEALASLAGTYVANDRVYDYLGTRGFLVPGDYNTRFLLLIDGQRTSDNVYEQAQFSEEFPLDLSLVERIEYVPGPGSSIYGGNAIFGVINVITRRAEEMPPLQLSMRLSEDGWREGRATIARKFTSGATLLLSVGEGDKEGRGETYRDRYGMLIRPGGIAAPDGRAHDLDRMHRRQLFARYEDGGFSLAVRHAERSVRPSSALYGTLFDDAGFTVDDRYSNVLARYQRPLGDETSMDARLEFGEVGYRADYPYDDGAGNRYINRDDTLGRWWTGEVRLLHTGFGNHKLVGGAELQTDTLARQRNFDVRVTLNDPIDANSERRRLGFYLQDEWRLGERWRLNTGVRHDRISSGDGTTSPRIGLIWLASDATTFKILGGRAFRQANAYERDYANGVVYLANPDLKPETIRTLEAVWSQRLGARHSVDLSLFDYHIDHLIAQVESGSGELQYQNQPEIKARGVEATWRANWEWGGQLSAGLAINHTEDKDGHRPGFSPRWIAKVRGSAPLPGERWLAAVDARALPATTYRWSDTSQRLRMRVLVDASLTTARLAPGLDGILRIRNLFDRSYAYPASDEAPVPSIPGRRRTLELGLRYAF